MAARVLAEHQAGVAHSDRLGRHDLVGGVMAQHAVLVDAAFMGEGVAAHDGLVGLDLIAGDVGQGLTGAVDGLVIHTGGEGHHVVTH